jgi:putative transposase
MVAIEAVTTTGETAALCHSVGPARATLYRRRQPARVSAPTPRGPSSRAKVQAERQAVLDILHSERFVDQSPAEVQATLLEEQTYLCYGRTATILEVRHRTRLAAYARHPERFVQGPPCLELLPHAVWINPPAKSTAQDAPGSTIVTPVDPQHGGMNAAPVTLEHQSTALTRTAELLQ